MSEQHQTPGAPATHDAVEVVDQRTQYRVTAVVEEAAGAEWILAFDPGAVIPQRATVHWDCGDAGWQAKASLGHLDDARATFVLAPQAEWEPAPVRRSLRTPVANSPMLIKLLGDGGAVKERRVHAVCLDISDTGCRATWPGSAPIVGADVEVAWEATSWRDDDVQPEWIAARVARIVSMPFGGRQVGLTFKLETSVDKQRVHAWLQAWIHEHRRRTLLHRAA